MKLYLTISKSFINSGDDSSFVKDIFSRSFSSVQSLETSILSDAERLGILDKENERVDNLNQDEASEVMHLFLVCMFF